MRHRAHRILLSIEQCLFPCGTDFSMKPLFSMCMNPTEVNCVAIQMKAVGKYLYIYDTVLPQNKVAIVILIKCNYQVDKTLV